MKYIKKILSVSVIFAVIFALVGCGLLNFDDESAIKEKTKTRAIEVLATLENGDREAFRVSFEAWICDMPDYGKGENYSFDFFKGEVLSVEQRTFHTGERISNVQDSYKTATGTYDVVTSEGEYVVYIQYFISHTNEEYIGKLRKFKLIDKKDAEPGCCAEMGWKYGVYYPGWVDE